MKIIQIKIGLADFNNIDIPFAFVKDDHNYFAEAIEDGGKYYYRIDGFTIEIEKWEYERVLGNPRLYYFSTAAKLHHRIRHARRTATPKAEHDSPTCILKKTPLDGTQVVVPGPKPVPIRQKGLDILVITDDLSARD